MLCIGIVGTAILLSAFLGLSYRVYRSYWGPFTILVVDFEGSSDIKTRLRDEVWNSLSTALKGKPGIKLLNPSGPLSGPQELVALEEARRRDADLVIWGNRWVAENVEKLDIHFDVVTQRARNEQLSSERINVLRNIASSDPNTQLNHFNIEIDVAHDLTYLALTALAVSRRSNGDLDGAIEAFSLAIQNVNQQRQVLQSGESVIKPSSAAMLLFQRGSTYLLKHDHTAALSDFLAATEKDKYVGAAGLALGAFATLTSGENEIAIIFAHHMVQAIPEPDNYLGYYLQGKAFFQLSEATSDLKERLKSLGAGISAMEKAIGLLGSDARFDDTRKLMASDIAGPYVVFGYIVGISNPGQSEEIFKKAREFASMSGDKQLQEKVEKLISNTKDALTKRNKEANH